MAFVIALCTMQFDVPMSASLKDKRHAIKPIVAHLRNHFNVSVAEVDDLDSRNRATLAAVCVSGDSNYAHGLLMKVISSVEKLRADATLMDYRIEML